jgi:hypothetical protein
MGMATYSVTGRFSGDALVWFVEGWTDEGAFQVVQFATEREAHAELRRLRGIEEETD